VGVKICKRFGPIKECDNKLDSPSLGFFLFSFFCFFLVVELKLNPTINPNIFFYFILLFIIISIIILYIIYIIIIFNQTNAFTWTKLGVDSCPSLLRFD